MMLYTLLVTIAVATASVPLLDHLLKKPTQKVRVRIDHDERGR